MTLTEWRTFLEKRKGQRRQIRESLKRSKSSLSLYTEELTHHEQAKTILDEAGLRTQQSLSYCIGEITSLALEAVFPDPYTLVVEFVQRRDKTECDLLFEREGEKSEPMDACGGGTVDVASFALRIASWSMQSPKSRNTIILDEPFKNIDATLQEKGALMLKEVSQRLDIQFIIVTHNETLASLADRTFTVVRRRAVSKVYVTDADGQM